MLGARLTEEAVLTEAAVPTKEAVRSEQAVRTEEAVARMNAAQRHRGPDDRGPWSVAFERGEIALGNTRLAILDTSSAGHQPMLDPET
ncbi:MAG TPA: hypothetical protein VIK76_20490, partial [Pyrinomonadaceae bacterium]